MARTTKTLDDCKRAPLRPWADGVPLMGPDVPEDNGQIVHLIRYLVTVYERFGDTRVREDITLSWGATALHKCDAQKAEIARLNDRAAKLNQYNATLVIRNERLAKRALEFERMVATPCGTECRFDQTGFYHAPGCPNVQ